MVPLLSIALGATVIFIAVRMWRERRRALALAEAMRTRNLHLPEDAAGLPHTGWARLTAAANALIEDLKELEQKRHGQLAQLEATLENLQEAVLIADGDNTVVLANQIVLELVPGTGPIVGQRIHRALPNPAFFAFVEEVRRGPNDRKHRREFEFIQPEGHSKWLMINGTRLPSQGGDGPWLLFVVDDITREKHLEGIQRDFVANVSHELRTPISVIRGYAETLVEDHDRVTPEDRLRFLQAIQRHAQRLSNLAEDLLTISRLDSKYPGLQFERLDMHELLKQLHEDFLARCRSNGHTFTLETEATRPHIQGDALKLSQVLENLVDNAVKYTQRGGQIAIRTQNQGELIVVSVSDNGVGIPEKDLPRIFERFYRVEKGRSREKGGTGLGLSIVYDIVQLHNGRVWVESQVGVGTTFRFSLPLTPRLDTRAPFATAGDPRRPGT